MFLRASANLAPKATLKPVSVPLSYALLFLLHSAKIASLKLLRRKIKITD
jgi:hypothetical protein